MKHYFHSKEYQTLVKKFTVVGKYSINWEEAFASVGNFILEPGVDNAEFRMWLRHFEDNEKK
jgi:hypothetical protein